MRTLERFGLRALAGACLAAFMTFGTSVGAQEEAKVQTLEERMDEIQAELDATTAEIEDLRTDEDRLRLELATTHLELQKVERQNSALVERISEIARGLYMGTGDATVEAVLGSEDMGEAAARLEYIEAAGEEIDRVFLDQERTEALLIERRDELDRSVAELSQVESSLETESDRLQEQFAAAADEYEALKEKMREEAEARRLAAAEAASGFVPSGIDGMTCPIDGPNSFIDSWGYPRSGGRSHEGTDMMAAFGTPVVAITDGRITYAGVGGLSGNWIVVTGDDGHEYMYMHNRENLKTSGRVRVGELIATVGDTGNARGGPPHVHFEYHPGGGEPVNPYPLLERIC